MTYKIGKALLLLQQQENDKKSSLAGSVGWPEAAGPSLGSKKSPVTPHLQLEPGGKPGQVELNQVCSLGVSG